MTENLTEAKEMTVRIVVEMPGLTAAQINALHAMIEGYLLFLSLPLPTWTADNELIAHGLTETGADELIDFLATLGELVGLEPGGTRYVQTDS